MKKISISLLSVLFFVIACGEEKKPEPATATATATATAEAPKETPKPANDFSQKIKEYEGFVTKFCALSEKMKGAGAMEKVTLAADFAKEVSTFNALTTDISSIKASAADDQKKQIESATAKGAACAKAAAL